MGVCASKKQLYERDFHNVVQEIDVFNKKLHTLNEYFTNIQYENSELKREVAKLTLKIENYGMAFSGLPPDRMTPTSYEISKRVGSITI